MAKYKKHKSAKKPVKRAKYIRRQIVLAFVALLAVFILYGLYQAHQAQLDVQTRKIANEKGAQLESYIGAHGTAPSSLEEAGISNLPYDTIYYSKRGNTSYSYCVKFHRTNNAAASTIHQIFDLYWPSSPGIYDKDQPLESVEQGTLVVDDTHRSETNCENVSDYRVTPRESWTDWSSYAKLSNVVCGVKYASSDTYHFSGMKKMSIDGYLIKLNTLPSDSGQLPSYVNDPAMMVFNSDCSAISLSDLQPGDSISVYTIEYPYPIGYGFDRLIAIKKQ